MTVEKGISIRLCFSPLTPYMTSNVLNGTFIHNIITDVSLDRRSDFILVRVSWTFLCDYISIYNKSVHHLRRCRPVVDTLRLKYSNIAMHSLCYVFKRMSVGYDVDKMTIRDGQHTRI